MIAGDANDMVIREKYNNVLEEMKERYRYTRSTRVYYEEGKGYWKYNVEYRFDNSNNVLLVKRTTSSFDDDFNIINYLDHTYLYYDPIQHIFLTDTTSIQEHIFEQV